MLQFIDLLTNMYLLTFILRSYFYLCIYLFIYVPVIFYLFILPYTMILMLPFLQGKKLYNIHVVLSCLNFFLLIHYFPLFHIHCNNIIHYANII